MKRLIVVLMALTMSLTGCAKQKSPLVMPGDIYNTSGEKTVLYYGDQKFPLSFTVDGVQQIPNGTYWYYELADQFGKDWDESFYTYDRKNLELSGTRPYGKLGKKNCYATNGNWALFLYPVHTEYTVSNQSVVASAFITLVKQELASNQMENAPPIVTDVWTCDLDGDGEDEYFIRACNFTLPAEEPKAEEQIQKDAADTYCFLAYIKGDVCQVLSGSFQKEENEQGEAMVLAPFTYDENGNLKQTVLRKSKAYSPIMELSPVVCDLNGDGKWEVMVYRVRDYKSMTTFQYKNGNFTKNYEIIF